MVLLCLDTERFVVTECDGEERQAAGETTWPLAGDELSWSGVCWGTAQPRDRTRGLSSHCKTRGSLRDV